MNGNETAFETTITCSVAQADRIHDQVLPALASYLQLAEPAYALQVQIRLTVRTADQRLTQALRALVLEDRADPIAELRNHLDREFDTRQYMLPLVLVLPCRKCGQQPEVHHLDGDCWSVDCLYCGAQTSSTYPRRYEAIVAWNRDHGKLVETEKTEETTISAPVPTPEPIPPSADAVQETPILTDYSTPIVLPCQNHEEDTNTHGLVAAGDKHSARCPNCGFMFIRRRKDQCFCMKPECRKAAVRETAEKWRKEHGKRNAGPDGEE
ncbi:MAG: hypothetical protein PHQ40_00495 [Anaerolineaceae bacterium]|nr:hypothetical protein [Anaerolineaceae bacterium]MDD5367535.1 hypothetical protein [Anaerolineaceae bacterium]